MLAHDSRTGLDGVHSPSRQAESGTAGCPGDVSQTMLRQGPPGSCALLDWAGWCQPRATYMTGDLPSEADHGQAGPLWAEVWCSYAVCFVSY